MGAFRTTVRVTNVVHRTKTATISQASIDTGSEFTWIPSETLERIGVKREKKDLSFVMANGETVTRSVGFAIVQVGTGFTVDEVVFGERGDQTLLGARTLEGLNVRVDPTRKRLVAAGPVPAAAADCG